MRRYHPFFTALFLFAGGLIMSCTGVHSLIKPEYKDLKPVRTAAEIEVLYQAPEKPHRIIGELSMDFNKTSREKVIEALKAEAARLGGDGIILDNVRTFRNEWDVTGETPGYRSKVGATRYRLYGVIYRYLPETH